MMDEAVPRSGAPKWQRARLLAHPDYSNTEIPVGFEFWVRAEKPTLRNCRGYVSGRYMGTNTRERYLTNVVAAGRIGVWSVASQRVELLPEFADEPEAQDITELIKGRLAESNAATAVTESTNANPKGD